jgi:flavin reductase (DIM6/NTAB) family NADH-FMN oxidoreductase RutF
MEPMRVLFCLSVTSESYPYLMRGSAVGISILNAGQRVLSDRFASKVAVGAYDDVSICQRAAHAPLLDGALGHVTGLVVDLIPSGDHTIVLCDVTSAHAENDGAPLLYCKRAYHGLRHFN